MSKHETVNLDKYSDEEKKEAIRAKQKIDIF
jgi:hypothetical protein